MCTSHAIHGHLEHMSSSSPPQTSPTMYKWHHINLVLETILNCTAEQQAKVKLEGKKITIKRHNLMLSSSAGTCLWEAITVLGRGGPWIYIEQCLDMNTVLVILGPQFTHQHMEIVPSVNEGSRVRPNWKNLQYQTLQTILVRTMKGLEHYFSTCGSRPLWGGLSMDPFNWGHQKPLENTDILHYNS